MGKFIDMTGWVMSEHGVPESRLTVINKDHTEKVGNRTRVYWNCRCSCGNYICLSLHSISSKGATKSCGCLNIEKIRQQGLKNRKYNEWSEKQIDEHGEYYIGYATNTNEPFYVDAQDFDTVKQYSWRTHRPSKTSPDFKILLAYILGIGTYDDKGDAIRARLEGEKKYFGEFAPQKHLFKEYGVEED